MNKIRGFLPATLLLALAISLCAEAHRLVEADEPHTSRETALIIEEPGLSQVVYHEVTAAENQLWLEFDAAAGEDLYWQVGLPALERLEDYRPVVVLLGPGLPDIVNVPFAVPEGYGGLRLDTAGAEAETFFEPFTGTESWILHEEEVTLEVAGTYYLVGYHPEDTPGKFWLAIGKREEFGLGDILGYADVLHFVRDYHEDSAAPLSLLNWGLIALSFVAQIVLAPVLWVLEIFA